MLFIATRTPLPLYLELSPSLRTVASCDPAEAPYGTDALPIVPDSSSTSTSTVGYPPEAKIS